MTSPKTTFATYGILATLLFNSLALHAQSLDPNFNVAPVIRSANIEQFVEYNDGGILAYGQITHFGAEAVAKNFVKINPDGSRDVSFSPETGLYYITVSQSGEIAGFDGLHIVKLNRRGKIIAKSKEIWPGINSLAFLPDGRIVAGNWMGSLRCYDHLLNDDKRFRGSSSFVDGQISDIKLQGRKILVAGYFETAQGVNRRGIVRLNMDGSVDESFDANLGVGSSVSTIFVQDDEKLIFTNSYVFDEGGEQQAFFRLNPDGSRDTSFNPSYTGYVGEVWQHGDKLFIKDFYQISRINLDGSPDDTYPTIQLYSPVYSETIVTRDGELITSNEIDRFTPFGILKYDASGSVVENFHPELSRPGLLKAVAEQEGKVIIGGDFFQVGDVRTRNIARLNSDGSADPSFSAQVSAVWPVIKVAVVGDGILYANGVQLLKVDFNGNSDWSFFSGGLMLGAKNFEVLADGRILQSGGNGIARLNADGSLDPSFNMRSWPCCSYYDVDFARQSDGKIILITSPYADTGLPQLVRLDADGNVDNTFMSSGPTGLYDILIDVEVLENDDIVLSGFITSINGVAITDNLAKLTPDGEVDPQFQQNFDAGKEVFISLRARKYGDLFGSVAYGGGLPNALQFYSSDGNTVQVVPTAVKSIWGEFTDIYTPDGSSLYIMGEIEVEGVAQKQSLIRVLNPTATTTVEQFSFEIFPNPASDFLHLSGDVPLLFQIRSLDGNTVRTTSSSPGAREIDIRDLPSGRYLFIANGSAKQFVKK